MTTVLVSADITSDTTWIGGVNYIITKDIVVKTGVTLTILDYASVCFLNGSSFSITFQPGSFLVAGKVKSFGVDSSYNPVSTANSGGWIFYGTRAAFNGVIPVRSSRFRIYEMSLANMGNSIIGAINVIYGNEYETDFNLLKFTNTTAPLRSIFSTVNIYQLGLTNTVGISLSGSVLNIFKKFKVVGGSVVNSLITSSIILKQNIRLYINATLANTFKITTNDIRIPTTVPYATPYVANVVNVQSRTRIYPLLVL